jgi:hypothetical protein
MFERKAHCARFMILQVQRCLKNVDMTNTPTLVRRLFYFTTDEQIYIDDPPLNRVIEEIEALNGDDIDTVGIKLNTLNSMAVGGGKEGQYKCHATMKGVLYDLLDPQLPRQVNDKVEIMMDQEISSYPRCCIVSREMVMEAIKCFCTTGELSSNLTWDNTLEYEPL